MNKVKFRKLHKYKYQLMSPHRFDSGIKGYSAITEFILLFEDGHITAKSGYAWDGASGPAIDTDNFIIPSLKHDILYQLIRMKVLPETARKQADILLRKDCLANGMWRLRAWWVYFGVRTGGYWAAIPGSQEQDTIYELPDNIKET